MADKRAELLEDLISKIISALQEHSQIPYIELREEVIFQHGYNAFFNLQSRAFSRMFNYNE